MDESVIALRALNDYRRRSPLTYLGIRNILKSAAGRSEKWARDVSSALVKRSVGPAHLQTKLFKEANEQGIEFRTVGLPGPTEAIAEAALLLECAQIRGPFSDSADVFSYRLSPPKSPEGSFLRYFPLFGARHRAIAEVCRRHPSDLVVYADIRKFYPSVRRGISLQAWTSACDKSGLGVTWRELGMHFLRNQTQLGKGLLIGPQFSHLVAHLVLAEFDSKMRERFRGRFFRYVDDVALVIPKTVQDDALMFVENQLDRLGLRLNRRKIFDLPAAEWRKHAPYQEGLNSRDDPTADPWWMAFIDSLKCFLMIRPDNHGNLLRAFRSEGVRIPLPRYDAAVQEAGYVERFERRLAKQGFRHRISGLTIPSLIKKALLARARYTQEFLESWQAFESAEGLKRKWLLSRLKYLSGRLIHLALDNDLAVLVDLLGTTPDLAEHHAVAKAIQTRDVSDLLAFGGGACVSAGQVFAASGISVNCRPKRWSPEAIDGYAMLCLMGTRFREPIARAARRDPAIRYVVERFSEADWAKQKLPFFRELFALAGTSSGNEQRALFDSPIDPDERWVLFSDDLSQPSS